ncbi:hypothetical protein CS374_03930 [Porphyromonas gingivalis]|nr:hypothetical protein CS374_03930 [Porphyromonas gingivalis]
MFAHNGYWLHPANCQLFSVHVKLPEPCFFRLSILYFLEPEASLDITLQRQKGETKKTSNPTSTKKISFVRP